MPSMRPLHFPQRIVFNDGIDDLGKPKSSLAVVPIYGENQYDTHCRRFTVYKTENNQWKVKSTYYAFHVRLEQIGIAHIEFPTRAAVIEALEIGFESLPSDNRSMTGG